MKLSLLPLAPLFALLLAQSAQADTPREETTDAGIRIVHLREGSGASPVATDTVRVHYKGELPDGKVFDSSYIREMPASFPLGRVIPCWTQGMQRIKVGGKARLICPANLAYGSRGVPGRIPPDTPLMFEVELLDIVK